MICKHVLAFTFNDGGASKSSNRCLLLETASESSRALSTGGGVQKMPQPAGMNKKSLRVPLDACGVYIV
jgi:hypothetical protein